MAAYSGALIFDCDGVLVETEELHRCAYNDAFATFDLRVGNEPVVWSTEYYDKLQNTVGGGEAKMRYHFKEVVGEWPTVAKEWREPDTFMSKAPCTDEEGMALISILQDYKTMVYKELVSTAVPRPGVLELLDSAINMPGIAVGICSASTREGFEKLVDTIVGQERLNKLDVIIAGDDVENKKPHPEIYNVAAKRLQLDPRTCVVVEDSLIGLRAAKAAGMKCVITYTSSTASVDFYGEGADAKLLDFSAGVGVDAFFGSDGSVNEDLLLDLRDKK